MTQPLPPDVMNDLLTLYLAGEASPATRALVESYARDNPGFARAMSAAASQITIPEVQPKENLEMTALKQVRQFLFLRSLFFGMGIAFTLIPFLFTFHNRTVPFFLLRDAPGIGFAALSLAVASWSAYYVMHRQVRKAGL